MDYFREKANSSDVRLFRWFQAAISSEKGEVQADDISKLIGCINALSKRTLLDKELVRATTLGFGSESYVRSSGKTLIWRSVYCVYGRRYNGFTESH